MDFLPFTLFFTVCLFSFQRNVLGKPATEADLKDPWAQKCDKELDEKNYCTQKLTGHDYPTIEELKQLYHDYIDKDFESQYNETVFRGGGNICRNYNYLVNDITMIRDEHNSSRYTLNIPGVYDISIPVQECQPDASKMLDRNYRWKNITCVQKSFQYPFIVLSQDKKSLELVKIKGIHSSCDPAVQNTVLENINL